MAGVQEAPNFTKAKKIIDNEDYIIKDLVLRDGTQRVLFTKSETELKPGRATRGHQHDDKGEVYDFVSGEGIMVLGNSSVYTVEPYSVIFVAAGVRHQVLNRSKTISLKFWTYYHGESARPSFPKKV